MITSLQMPQIVNYYRTWHQLPQQVKVYLKRNSMWGEILSFL